MKSKKLFLCLVVLSLVSCSKGEEPLSSSGSSFNSTTILEEKIEWEKEPMVASFQGEEFKLSDYGSVNIRHKGENATKKVELNQTNYINFDQINIQSLEEQTLIAEVENLPITYSFQLTKKEINLSSLDVIKKMGVGINLGDTFESDIGNYFTNSDPDYALKIYEELGYKDINGEHDELFCEVRQHYTPYRGKTTINTINAIYKKGFRSIRIPVAWSNHMKDDVISERWIARVKEVVDYCFTYNDLYVVLTLMEPPSFSGYWLDDEYKDATLALVTNVWTQVSKRFRGYDHRLIFENLNEPLSKKHQWNMAAVMESNPDAYKEANENLMLYNQTFVNIIRNAPGNNNKKRFLTVNTYGNMAYLGYEENVNNISQFTFPSDTIEDHLIYNVHIYSPNDFSFGRTNAWSTSNAQDKAAIDGVMDQLKKNYLDKGIGVLVSEWGAVHANDDNADREKVREEYYYYFMKKATETGLSYMIWDNTAIGNSWKEGFGFLNRHKAAGIYDDLVVTSGAPYNNETLWFYENVLDQMFSAYNDAKIR